MKTLIFLVIFAGFTATALAQLTTTPTLSGPTPSFGGPWANSVFYVRDWTPGSWPGLPDSTDNKMPNGGFEGAGFQPWFIHANTTGTVTRVLDQTGALEGDYYMRMENDTGENCGLKQAINLTAIGVLPGTRIVCGTAIRLSTGYFCTSWSGGQAKIEIAWKKIDGTPVSTDSVTAKAALDEWTMISGLFTVPQEAERADILLALQEVPSFGTTQAVTPYRAEFDATSFYREPDREFLTRIGGDQWTGPRGLLLTLTGIEPIEDGFRIRASLANTGADRVVIDLGYAPPIRLPLNGRQPVWHNGFTDAVEAHEGLHLLAEPVDSGANWPVQSGYPFSALSLRNRVHSLAVPLDEPRVAHTAFNADEGIHLIEFHLGLLGSGETGYEDYAFAADKVILKSDWGFRAAAKSYLSRYGHLIEPNPIAVAGALCDPADPDWGPYLEEMGMRYFQTMSSAEVDTYGGDFIPLLYSCPWTLRFSYGDPPIALDFATIMSTCDTWMATFSTQG
jgi:hypothetical protein